MSSAQGPRAAGMEASANDAGADTPVGLELLSSKEAES